MAVNASAKNIRISPRKVAPVAALVRGRTVSDALVILSHTNRRAALPVKKVIASAKANADYNHGYKPDTLRITSISVTPGTRYKRFMPVARGGANPYKISLSHIFVQVDGEKRQSKKSIETGSKVAKAEATKTEPKAKTARKSASTSSSKTAPKMTASKGKKGTK
jgi:large subunit ribosomal protein L22